MSYNFEGDNIFCVGPGEKLEYFDLYHWNLVKWPVRSGRAVVALKNRPEVNREIKDCLPRCVYERWDLDGRLRPEDRRVDDRGKLIQFGKLIEYDKIGRVQVWPKRLTYPTPFDLWVRISDRPLEAFDAGDYPDRSEGAQTAPRWTLTATGEIAITLTEDCEGGLDWYDSYREVAVRFPQGELEVGAIPVDQPLPIIHGYCGYFVRDGWNQVVNYAPSRSRDVVYEDALACAPLNQRDGFCFGTFYFYSGTDGRAYAHKIALALNPTRLPGVEAVLRELGYQAGLAGDKFRIFRRNEDVMHLYTGIDPEGPPDEFPSVTCFALAAQADGSADPEKREQIRMELAGRLSAADKEVPDLANENNSGDQDGEEGDVGCH